MFKRRETSISRQQFGVSWVRQLVYTYESAGTSFFADVVLQMSRLPYYHKNDKTVHCLLSRYLIVSTNLWRQTSKASGEIHAVANIIVQA